MIIERDDRQEGVLEHHLAAGVCLPPEDDDEDQGYDPDVIVAYDELAKLKKLKRRKKK